MFTPLLILLLACSQPTKGPLDGPADSEVLGDTQRDETGETGGDDSTRDTEETADTGETNDPGPLELFGLDAATVDEGEALALSYTLSRPARLFAVGLPPGARWDEAAGTLSFTPDSIQGGRAWSVTLVATDGVTQVEREVTIEALDTITPPPPVVISAVTGAGWTRYLLSQTTDEWLDSPGNAGRSLSAILCVPTAATVDAPAPVQVGLHGIGASPSAACSTSTVLLNPSDPDVSFWFGYATNLPAAAPSGEVLP